MKITRIINNNVVSAQEDSGEETVVMGKGIGFKTAAGQEIPKEKIEKVFRMDNPGVFDKFKQLLEQLPPEHFQISNDIISYAKLKLNKQLNQSIYLTLTDHINFALTRYEQGMEFQNALLWEVQSFYQEEFEIGEYALQLIEQHLGVRFLEDEAASIALHIVNAEYNTELRMAMDIPQLLHEVLKIVEQCFGQEIDQTGIHYNRFVTHLKFLGVRLFQEEYREKEEDEFCTIIRTSYPEEYACAVQIAGFIKERYGVQVYSEELACLTIHIKRVRRTGPAQ